MADIVENIFKVNLVSKRDSSRKIVFHVSPTITESTLVNYQTLNPIHSPASIYVYGGTAARSFALSGVKLIARNKEEAQQTLTDLNLLRSWTKPYFGQQIVGEPGFLGMPPEVLYFSAYSSSNHKLNLYKIPVVILSLSIPYSIDVDYLSSQTGDPTPAIVDVDMQLAEAHSPRSLSNFNLKKYREGNLENF